MTDRFVKTARRVGIALVAVPVSLVLVVLVTGLVLYYTADLAEPSFRATDGQACVSDSLRIYGNNWLRLSDSGLWEMKLEGGDFERGEAYGKMGADLLYRQEEVFVEQIRKMVPSGSYLSFLHKFILIFNRNLGRNVPEEYRKELYGMSLYCSPEFDLFGTPYERQMHYHSAHDIGHALQDFMLVGCSSFAVRNTMSADSSLLVGRNFDFYMGEGFAENKMVDFIRPSSGHAFVSVSWPGMMGVLSGMNEKGLTVTINAAKLEIPTSSATPISILTRRILQYASTIREAVDIAGSMNTFVSESILVSSASENKAVIIEKSPRDMGVYDPMSSEKKDLLVCTNHFQSERFADNKKNIRNIEMSDSKPRYDRVVELADSLAPIDVDKAVAILRDKKGVGGSNLPYGSEYAVNQLIAHHSVVMQPSKLCLWLSVGPWQCGRYVCYDLAKVLDADPRKEVREDVYIEEDPFLHTPECENVRQMRKNGWNFEEEPSGNSNLEPD